MDQGFPRVYRTGRAGRIFFLCLGVVLIAAGVAVALLMLVAAKDPAAGMLGAASISATLLFLGSYVIVGVTRGRVVLEADAIEIHGTFTSRRMRREDIAGRRRIQRGHGQSAVRLMPRQTHEKSLTIASQYKTDAAFDAWFEGIPDLDVEEAQVSLDSILADPDLTGSREEKLSALARAQRVAGLFTWPTLAVCMWLWIYPHPYDLAVACVAILPWIAAIIAARNPIYRLNPKRNDVRANLAPPYLVPGMLLAVRALKDTNLIDWKEALMATAIGTALCTLLMIWLVRELRHNVTLTAIFMCMYACGALTLANVRFDGGKPESYEAAVLSARVTSDRHARYFMELGPWGPRTTAEEINVGRRFYERASNLKSVCVHLHRGALRVRWFELDDCGAFSAASP